MLTKKIKTIVLATSCLLAVTAFTSCGSGEPKAPDADTTKKVEPVAKPDTTTKSGDTAKDKPIVNPTIKTPANGN